MDHLTEITKDKTPGQTVVFMFRAARIGGSERRAGELAIELDKCGVNAVAINIASPDSQASGYFKHSFPRSHSEPSVRKALKRCIHYSPDAIITFGMQQSLPLRLCPIPRISSAVHFNARNGLDMEWPNSWHWIDAATQFRTRYLVNSTAVRNHLIKNRIRGQRVTVLPPALPDEWFVDPTKQESRTVTVAMVGNNRPEKNQLAGLKAFRNMKTEAHLNIYTDDATSLYRSKEYSDLGERVTIRTGHTLTPSDYDQIDVLLHPSLSESIPRAVLEAASRGCRIAATNVGATRDVLPSGSIILSPKPTVQEMATALDRLTPNEPLGPAHRARPRNEWSLTAYAQTFYRAVLDTTATP